MEKSAGTELAVRVALLVLYLPLEPCNRQVHAKMRTESIGQWDAIAQHTRAGITGKARFYQIWRLK